MCYASNGLLPIAKPGMKSKCLLFEIDFIKILGAQQALIIQNNSDYLYYTIPGEYGAYALYEGTKDNNWVFLLPDGRMVTYPIDPDFDALEHAPIGTRVAILLNAAGEIQSFHVSFHQP